MTFPRDRRLIVGHQKLREQGHPHPAIYSGVIRDGWRKIYWLCAHEHVGQKAARQCAAEHLATALLNEPAPPTTPEGHDG